MMYQAVYKCRLCGEEFKGCVTGNENIAMVETINAASGIKSTQPLAPRIIEYHYCKDGSYGIADFQGFKKVED